MNNNSNNMNFSELNNIDIYDSEIILNKIKTLFNQNIKNKKYDTTLIKHCGSEGCWIENQLGIYNNNNNKSDFLGYEIKKKSKKITFGDWSANEYMFKSEYILNTFNEDIKFTKLKFLKLFGQYNFKKKRYSWSGMNFPSKYNIWTYSGQLLICNNNNDLFIIYSYHHDKRSNKKIPKKIQNKEYIILAYWNYDSLKKKLERKFNNFGTILFNKNKHNIYTSISIYKPITIDFFMDSLKSKKIILDSGMYEKNTRNYSQFRANYNFWNELLIEEY